MPATFIVAPVASRFAFWPNCVAGFFSQNERTAAGIRAMTSAPRVAHASSPLDDTAATFAITFLATTDSLSIRPRVILTRQDVRPRAEHFESYESASCLVCYSAGWQSAAPMMGHAHSPCTPFLPASIFKPVCSPLFIIRVQGLVYRQPKYTPGYQDSNTRSGSLRFLCEVDIKNRPPLSD